MRRGTTMGSLFSGSGGFELAGIICGIRPAWASEIEPLPILGKGRAGGIATAGNKKALAAGERKPGRITKKPIPL